MKKKYGFTLAEILICIAVVSVIFGVSFSTFKNFDKGIRYIYSNTYHALDRALYNGINFSNLDDAFEQQTVNKNGQLVNVSSEEGAQRLCALLTEYINTLEVNCNAGLANDLGTNFGTPHFVAGNGVRFYISKRMRGTLNNGISGPAFYLVYADINGEKGPNSMNYEPASEANGNKTIDPDIFAFAALDIGRVCPLGPPEFDPRYMLTRIIYNAVENRVIEGVASTEAVTKYTKNSKPYYISKAEAWGYYLKENPIDENTIIDDSPYSYNGYIKKTISSESKIYSFLGGAKIVAPASVKLRSAPINNGGLGCRARSDEDCSVIIDRYVY